MDVVRNSLQGLEVGDLIDGVAGLLEQGLVHDDAEGFVAVADGNGLAGFVLQVEVGGGHLVVHVGAFEIVAELAVAVDSAEVADLEHGGGGVLVELGGQGGVVLAGSGCDDLHGNAGLLGVGLGNLLPGRVRLGLEVEVVHAAGRGRGFGFRGGLFRRGGFGLSRGARGLRRGSAAGDEAQNHDQSQKNSEKLLHCLFPPNF